MLKTFEVTKRSQKPTHSVTLHAEEKKPKVVKPKRDTRPIQAGDLKGEKNKTYEFFEDRVEKATIKERRHQKNEMEYQLIQNEDVLRGTFMDYPEDSFVQENRVEERYEGYDDRSVFYESDSFESDHFDYLSKPLVFHSINSDIGAMKVEDNDLSVLSFSDIGIDQIFSPKKKPTPTEEAAMEGQFIKTVTAVFEGNYLKVLSPEFEVVSQSKKGENKLLKTVVKKEKFPWLPTDIKFSELIPFTEKERMVGAKRQETNPQVFKDARMNRVLDQMSTYLKKVQAKGKDAKYFEKYLTKLNVRGSQPECLQPQYEQVVGVQPRNQVSERTSFDKKQQLGRFDKHSGK
jgi:hypothetical protein